jgi:murein DD-endopeptidase MepM/ murein hydrolase activator NlpD
VDNINDSGGDTWNPSGSWDWPISPTIQFHQGYGVTWFVRAYGWYSFHNGIDISGSSDNAYAVADGILYRGSYSVGCALSYVKLAHKDSNVATLYLHVYPQ